METEKLTEIIAHGAESFGIDLPPGALALFEMHYNLLEERGQNLNLTAITGAKDVARLHFLDSIALLNTVSFKNASIIDVGSGAGFPGVPLKIAESSISLTMLDATGKRVAFLSELCEILGMDAACIHARAEEASHSNHMRERYDIAVSRAVAQLDMLCELCLPLVRVGGFLIAMKAVDSGDEITKSQNAISILGAALQECHDYTIPGTDIVRRAVIIRKTSNTPGKYPRGFARIKKAPL